MPPGDALRSARDAAGRALAIDPDDCDALGGDRRGSPRAGPRRRRRPRRLREGAGDEREQRVRPPLLRLVPRRPRRPAPRRIAVADRAFSLDPLCIVMQTCAADVRYLARRLRGRAVAQPARAGDGAGLRAGMRSAARPSSSSDAAPTRSRSSTPCRNARAVPDVAGRSRPAPWPRPATSTRPAPSRGASNAPVRIAWCRRITSPRCTRALGDHDAAFAQLERACAAGDGWLDAVGVDPRFACLRGDDRLHAIRARLRLA